MTIKQLNATYNKDENYATSHRKFRLEIYKACQIVLSNRQASRVLITYNQVISGLRAAVQQS